MDVEAAEAHGDDRDRDRDRLYAGMVDLSPQFAEYELTTARKIPVSRLTRA